MDDLQNEKFIIKNDAGNWEITNMGALMIAKDLKKFDNLQILFKNRIEFSNVGAPLAAIDRIADTVPIFH